MNEGFHSLYEQLDKVREQIIATNLESYMMLACSLGALGALVYISYRVWRSLANAEPVDVFPLLRPFVLGLLIMNFSWVMGFMDGVVGAIQQGTEAVAESNRTELEQARLLLMKAEEAELAKKQEEKENRSTIEKIDDALKNPSSLLIDWDELKLDAENWFVKLLREALFWTMECAKLILYTVSSFMLLILTILGPIVFAFAIFDGFQSGLVSWIARYIHLSLWLPVANILQVMLNSIEIQMCNSQVASINGGNSSDMWFMIIFYLIGLVAFTTVPTVSGWIVEAGGGGGGFTRNLTSIGSRATAGAGAIAGLGVSKGYNAVSRAGSRVAKDGATLLKSLK